MYKVGDRIKIVRVDEKWMDSQHVSKFIDMVGKSYTVTSVRDDSVHLDTDFYIWNFNEIELDKNYYVTEILKDL